MFAHSEVTVFDFYSTLHFTLVIYSVTFFRGVKFSLNLGQIGNKWDKSNEQKTDLLKIEQHFINN